MVRPAAYREAVGLVTKELNLSVRRTCRALGFSRSSWNYKSRRAPQKELVARLRALASKRKRWGYRMLHALLRREGRAINHKRVYRLYCLEGLAVRHKARKRMARGPRVVPPLPTRPNERWSMDFVSDFTWSGRRYRILVVIDEFTREALALIVDSSFSGARVGRELDVIAAARGFPTASVVDNGPEFTSKALDAWAYRTGVELDFIRPGKPVDNAFVESFNGKLRNECLNQHWFHDLDEVREIVEAWRIDFNTVRPHSSLDGMTPSEYAIANRGLSAKAV